MEKTKRKNMYEGYPIEHWKIYVFQETIKKEKKLMDHYKALVLGLATIPCLVIGGLLIGVMSKGEGVAELLAILIGTSAITFLSYLGYLLQTEGAAAMKGYIQDETNTWWEVYLTEGSSSSNVTRPDTNLQMRLNSKKEAQKKQNFIKYLIRFKEGKREWNWFSGGKAKVTCLKGIKILKEKRKYYLCEYITERNKRKKIKIYKVYGE